MITVSRFSVGGSVPIARLFFPTARSCRTSLNKQRYSVLVNQVSADLHGPSGIWT
jgi:hypothetical protein